MIPQFEIIPEPNINLLNKDAEMHQALGISDERKEFMENESIRLIKETDNFVDLMQKATPMFENANEFFYFSFILGSNLEMLIALSGVK
jgi:hypothetical protein